MLRVCYFVMFWKLYLSTFGFLLHMCILFYAFKYIFFWEGVRRFHQTLKGFYGTKKVKNPCLFEGSQASPACPSDNSSVKMKLGVERWWNGTARGKEVPVEGCARPWSSLSPVRTSQ